MTPERNVMRTAWLHAKSSIEATSGVVTARHPLAAEAGLSVLRRGGNAIDAAIATIMATGVVQPFATTIGGGGLLTAVSPAGRTYTLDYRNEAPAAATPDLYGTVDITPGLYGWDGVPGRVNEIGHRAVAIPGSVPGWVAAHQELGQLPWADLLAPAIALARDGFEMDWYGSLTQGACLADLLRFDTTAQTFLRDRRYPQRPRMNEAGDVLRQPALAGTLLEIAEDGLAGYLERSAGPSLVREMQRNNGLITAVDLAEYRPRSATPVSVSFSDHTVLGSAHGGVYELLLTVLEQLDLANHDPFAPLRLHLVAEAIRRCRHIEATHAGDHQTPLWVEHPELGGQVAASIDRRRRDDNWRALWWAKRRSADVGREHTAQVCAVDSDGMMVSLTETILGSFGSAVTSSAGMLLNNSMFAFVPVPGHPNSVAAGHRPHSNMTPIVVVDKAGCPVLTAGASGGQRISAAVVQIVAYILCHGLEPQTAVAAPRLDVLGDTVLLDHRITDDTAATLEKLGHQVERVVEDLSTLYFANPAVVVRDGNGVMRTGVNPLHLTAASGW